MVSTSDELCPLAYDEGFIFDHGNVIPKLLLPNLGWRRQLREDTDDNAAEQVRQMDLCKASAVYWINAWVWTFNVNQVNRGISRRAATPHMPFVTWPVQDRAIDQLLQCIDMGVDVIIDKSRDMGASWLLVAIAYWYWLFQNDSQILLVSRTEDDVDKSGNPLSLFWKALALDTPVLTPSGWVNNGDLKVGDSVVGSDGKPVEIRAIHDHGTKPVFRVKFRDGTSVRCCGDHLWKVIGKAGSRVMRTEDMVGVNGISVPLTSPVEFENADSKDLPLDPYTLGALLGDGCLSKPSIEIASPASKAEIIERLVIPDGCSVRKSGSSSIISGRVKKFGIMQSALSSLGLRGARSWEKFVPKQYLMASPSCRTELLRGLMDTDGWISKNGYAGYETTSKQLSEDVVFLVRSLGGVANKTRSYPRSYMYLGEKRAGRVAYRTHFFLPTCPFHLKYKAERYLGNARAGKVVTSVAPDGESPVRCISIGGNHLYVVDGFTVTHNCDYITRRLPDWMLPADRREFLRGGLYRQHMHLGNASNNTSIDGDATTAHAGRGDRRTFVVFDEMAAIPNATEAWIAASDTTACKIGNSTPIGPGTEFSKQRNLGLERGVPKVITLGYWNHPTKGVGRERAVDVDGAITSMAGRVYWSTPWFDLQAKRRDKVDLCQNVLIDHLGSGDGVFNTVMVTRHMAEHGRDSLRCSLVLEDRWHFIPDPAGSWFVWCPLDKEGLPPKNTNYVIFADPSYGKGAANSAAAVYDRETGEAVAEYADPWATPGDLSEELVAAGKYVFKGQADSALLGWEENGPGESMYQDVLRADYPLVYYREKLGQDGKTKEKAYGWRSDRRNKRILMMAFGRMMLKQKITIHSREALGEMLRYTYYEDGSIGLATLKDVTTGARESHGDRVVAHAGASFLVGQAPRFEDRTPRYPAGSIGEIAEHGKWIDDDEQEAKDWYDQ